jgi:hypothetical protein
MGWKTLKEHYHIEHTVQVTEQGICIGSPYIHNIIVVGLDGTIVKAYEGHWADNKDINRYMSEMKSDPAKLREVVLAKDTFSASIPVFTYAGATIIKKLCETPGWPNCTHDGQMMYENTHSTDRNKVIAWAKENNTAALRLEFERSEQLEDETRKANKRLNKLKEQQVILDAMPAADQKDQVQD